MTKILSVVFDRNNAISPYSLVKQFDGNVYVNLEANDRIYYSVDGDFYNTGTTSFNGSVSVGVGESVNVTSEGGSVKIDLEDGFAYMTGPAVKICEGNLEV